MDHTREAAGQLDQAARVALRRVLDEEGCHSSQSLRALDDDARQANLMSETWRRMDGKMNIGTSIIEIRRQLAKGECFYPDW